MYMSRVELGPLKIRMLKAYRFRPQNVTLLGNSVIMEAIDLE